MLSIDEKEISVVSSKEKIDPKKLTRLIKGGSAVVFGRDDQARIAIGKNLRTKVNVNLGTSPVLCDEAEEIEKAAIAFSCGADTVSDCSTAGDIDGLRRNLIESSGMLVTTIPIYQAVVSAGTFEATTDEHILKTIEKHVNDGVSSVVIHAGFTRQTLNYLKQHGRIMGIVSRGGSMTAAISLCQDRENPFVTLIGSILEIMKGTGVVLNLGNAMRSGCVHDFKDEAQFQEIVANAKIARLANESGVPVIIEGLGGHVNALDLNSWIEEHNRITGNRPLFVAGPLPTEIGVGHDHISAAIGGAMAAGYGTYYLCAITPAEHLGLPNKNQVREGVVATKIAAHVGDSMKHGIGEFFEQDRVLSMWRSKKNWNKQFEQAIDPEAAKTIHPGDEQECSICGKFCPIAIMRKYGLQSPNDV